MLLGVNIDHVATLRQARGTSYPEPLTASILAAESGADSITVHLREDRRHIQDSDVTSLKEVLNIPLNLEMAVTAEMLQLARKLRPTYCCLVPERREELTTEGGLNVRDELGRIREGCEYLANAGIKVSLFIDADTEQIQAAADTGAPCIEIHTGHYADATTPDTCQRELEKITKAVTLAHELGLQVNAGHGLNYDNVTAIASIPDVIELNIGHSIIARSVFVGLPTAVKEMKQLIDQAVA
ncbi:MAG: pyridoxine 5'-phosphate synthase [Gammaproteobacteria bacterium]